MLHETCDWLRVQTLPGLWQILQRLDISYKRGREYVHSPDPHYSAKLAWIQAKAVAVRAAPERYALFYLDELTFYRQPSVAQAYAARGHEQAYAQRSHRSETSARVLAAMNALTGQVTYTLRTKTSLPTLRQFYYDLRQAYPTHETLYVVQDNWPVHWHPDITIILDKQSYPWPPKLPVYWPSESRRNIPSDPLPIQLLFLPTYASWTNPIEKLWRWLKQDYLHLHRHADAWDQLKAKVHEFLDKFSGSSPELLHYVGLLPN